MMNEEPTITQEGNTDSTKAGVVNGSETNNETPNKTWVDEAIEREAIPSQLRKDTIAEFCEKHGIGTTTYYYQMRKEENQKRIIEITLNKAKSECPDVLNTLVEKAKGGDMKAMDIYVDSILKLAKNLDIKSDGRPIVHLVNSIAEKNGIINKGTEPDRK